MGMGEEDQLKGHDSEVIIVKFDYADNKPKTLPQLHKKCTTERYLIVVLFLVIIGLMVALIIVSNRNRNSKERKLACSALGNQNNEETIFSKLDDDVKEMTPAPCEVGWIQKLRKCYYFSKKPDTWSNSKRFCSSHNASLVIIEDKNELEFLFRTKDGDNHWIGLKRTEDDKGWAWVNRVLYNENLFPIERSTYDNTECAYLNAGHVRSSYENFEYKWICSKT